MATFKFDLHVHTESVSSCGNVSENKLVKLFHQIGYSGLVVTDHYYKAFFEKLSGLSWHEKVDKYMYGYHLTKQEAKPFGLSILFGIEIRFTDSPNDYLVYGVDDEFLKENPELYNLNINKFRELIKGKNICIYQAHPFRPKMELVDPKLLDGIEVFNGNPRHNPRNEEAYQYAKRNKLKIISGSDFHELEDLGTGGVVLPKKVTTEQELVDILRNDEIISLIRQEVVK